MKKYSFTLVKELIEAFALAGFTEADLKRLADYENKEQIADLIYGLCETTSKHQRCEVITKKKLTVDKVGEWLRMISNNSSLPGVYLGENFRKWFDFNDLISEVVEINSFKLLRPMSYGEIISEVGHKENETTLADVLFLLKWKKLLSKKVNTFFIKDKNGILRSVFCFWIADGPCPCWALEARRILKYKKISNSYQLYFRS